MFFKIHLLTPEAIVAAGAHLYLLRHPTEDKFRVVCSRAFWAGKIPQPLRRQPQLEASLALLFVPNGVDGLIRKFRVSAGHDLVDAPDEDGSRWYSRQGVVSLRDYLETHLGPATAIPLQDVFPAHEEGRQRIQSAIQEAKARAEAEAAEARKAKRELAALWREKAHREDTGKRATYLANAGTFIGPQTAVEDWAPRVTALLRQLNVICNGFGEFERATSNIMLLVPVERVSEVKKICETLTSWVVVDFDPLKGVPDRAYRDDRLFGAPARNRWPMRTDRVQQFLITVSDVMLTELQGLTVLKPMLRGWDLGLTERVLGFDPSRSKRYRDQVADDTPPEWRQSWDLGRAIRDADHARYLARLGPDLWAPPSLRLLEPKHSEVGVAEVLVQLRDALGTPRGVQLIRTDTWQAREVIEPGCVAAGRIFRPKKRTLVATNLADAFVLRQLHQTPVWLAQSPEALSALPLSAELANLCIFFSAVPPAGWAEAVGALGVRAKVLGIGVRAVAPRSGGVSAENAGFEERFDVAVQMKAGRVTTLYQASRSQT